MPSTMTRTAKPTSPAVTADSSFPSRRFKFSLLSRCNQVRVTGARGETPPTTPSAS